MPAKKFADQLLFGSLLRLSQVARRLSNRHKARLAATEDASEPVRTIYANRLFVLRYRETQGVAGRAKFLLHKEVV